MADWITWIALIAACIGLAIVAIPSFIERDKELAAMSEDELKKQGWDHK